MATSGWANAPDAQVQKACAAIVAQKHGLSTRAAKVLQKAFSDLGIKLSNVMHIVAVPSANQAIWELLGGDPDRLLLLLQPHKQT